MKIQIVNPQNGLPLVHRDKKLIDENGSKFPIIDGIPIFVDSNNYADSLSFQWERFAKTQLEFGKEGDLYSPQRFFSETLWDPEDLTGENLLEVGSGAGDSMLIGTSMALATPNINPWAAALLGNILAAHQVSQIGNVPLNLDEVIRDIET